MKITGLYLQILSDEAQKIEENPTDHAPVKGTFRMPQGHEPPAADADHEELGDKVVAEYHPVMLGNHGDADQKCGIEADQQAHLFEGEGV